MTNQGPSFHAVIMAGGSGTRFWPLSRRSRPKQLLPLFGGECLLTRTLARFDRLPVDMPAQVWIVTGPRLAEATRAAVPDLSPDHVLIEPEPRNTAPCISLATARILTEAGRNAVTAFISADQLIEPVEEFQRLLAKAVERAALGSSIVTIGVEPDRPATGYGYVKRSDTPIEAPDVYSVESFVEKPDLARAQEYLAAGNYLWNTGMFVWRIDTVLAQMAEVSPELYVATMNQASAIENDDTKGIEAAFLKAPATSIDYALLERSNNIEVVDASFAWSDIGAYPALAEHFDADEQGNRAMHPDRLIAVEASDNIVIPADDRTVALLGVQGLAVVTTGDAILICPKDRCEEIRRIVKELEARGAEELL